MAVSVVSDSTNQPEPSPTFVAPSSILSRLRAETRHEHAAVERVLDLMSASLTRDGYRQRLAQFYGFYAPLETALKNCGKRQPDSALAARLNKTALLQLDLRHLGAMWQSSHFAPVVVVEDSDEDFDQAGANAYHGKPVRHDQYLSLLRSTLHYWLHCVSLQTALAKVR